MSYVAAAARAKWSGRASTSAALLAQHRGELAGVRREHRRAGSGPRRAAARRRRRRPGRRPPRRRRARLPASSPPPEPTTHACTRPAPTTSGCASRTRSATRRRRRRTGPSRHSPLAAPATLSRAAPGYCAAPGADADHAAGVLLAVRARSGQQRRDVLGLERLDLGLRQVEPDVDQVHRAAGPRRGVDEVADLVGAEGDRERRLDVVAVRAHRCRRPRRWECPPRRPVRRAAA